MTRLISKVKGKTVAFNDADYMVEPTINGKRVSCKFYRTWHHMIHRAYGNIFKLNNQTYIGVTVCESWLTFSNFKKWMESQNWHGNELDKDIINPNNKIYSPDNCCFVSSKVNLLLGNCRARRGKYPIGVYFNRVSNKFQASCSDGNGASKHLGFYKTPELAHAAWLKFKLSVIDEVIATLTDIRVIEGLTRHKVLLQNLYGEQPCD